VHVGLPRGENPGYAYDRLLFLNPSPKRINFIGLRIIWYDNPHISHTGNALFDAVDNCSTFRENRKALDLITA